MNDTHSQPTYAKSLKVAVSVLAVIVILAWLLMTPPGLLGKADAVGYAVCHRISTHSQFFGDRQMPLCARCSGMHLGALLGLLYQLRLGKRGGLPSRKILIVLGVFLLAFAIDGSNSYLTLGPETGNSIPILQNIHPLYTPQNWLRTLTGLLLGLGIAAVLYPVFNQTLWKDWDTRPALDSWKQLLVLIGLGLVVEAAVLSENVLLLYPLALLSSLNVLIVLGMIYMIVWTMIFRRENTFISLRQTWLLALAGLTTAFLQIGVMDYGRYVLTGTWDGFFAWIQFFS
jgi:uncharacterized membrane protein